MKRYKIVALAMGFALLLAACGGQGADAPKEDPDQQPEQTTEQDTAAAEPEDWDGYIKETAITVTGGRNLTLRLYGRELESDLYGIEKVLVLDGEQVLQELKVANAIELEWGDDAGFNSMTQSWDRDGGVSILDMNFDGSGDLGLQGWVTAGANVPYYYWLWDDATERFQYAFCMSNAEIDEERQQLVSRTREGAGVYTTTYYAWGDSGELVPMEQTTEITEADGSTAVQRYARQEDGSFRLVEDGSAG